MRLFHLTDLPGDLVFIRLEDRFQEDFLSGLKKVFGSYRKVGEFVGYTGGGIIETFRIKNRFTKLSTIIELAQFLSKKGYRDFNMDKVEEKVIAYRGIGTSSIIKNPNFPLKEDERMIRIFFHLLGDGYGGEYGKAKPFYRNYTKELLDEFANDLKVFGEVPYIKRETIVEIPSVIGYILKHVYKINFESHKSSIPPAIFELPKEVIVQGIKAFGDDEANVDDCRIRFHSSNKKLLTGIKELLIKTFPGFYEVVGEIRGRESYLRGKLYVCYSFPVLADGLKYYSDLIGFTHSSKLEFLNTNLARKKRRWSRRNTTITKLLILRGLKGGDKTIRVLARDVGITENITRAHFEGSKNGILSLREMNFVKSIGFTEMKGKILHITEKGLKFLEENKHRLKKFRIDANIFKFYLNLVRERQKVRNWAIPSEIAKRLNHRRDTVSKQLFKLWREGYLIRNRIGKEDYRYRLSKEGARFLKA